jgi:predicted membrane protein
MNSKSSKIVGGTIIAVGLLILIDNLFGGFGFWHFIWRLWPIALIILGIYIIKIRANITGDTGPGESASDNRLFGDLDVSITGDEAKDHRYSTLIGDIRIDAAGDKLASGENKIALFTLIGDVEIKIAEKLPVRLSSRFLIGDVRFGELKRDGFFQRLDHTDGDFGSSETRLVLEVNGLIGDLKIDRIKINDV